MMQMTDAEKSELSAAINAAFAADKSVADLASAMQETVTGFLVSRAADGTLPEDIRAKMAFDAAYPEIMEARRAGLVKASPVDV